MSLDIRPNPSATAGGVTGALVYKGSYDAATNTPNLTASSKRRLLYSLGWGDFGGRDSQCWEIISSLIKTLPLPLLRQCLM